jgi:hypothetical protein
MESLHDKSVKVRIWGGFGNSDIGSKKGIPDGSIAYTTGKPANKNPPSIEVKIMLPGTNPVSIPLCFLSPVQPVGLKERAVIIAGEHSGKEVFVKEMTSSSWKLLPCDSAGDTSTMLTQCPEYVVACAKLRL